MSSNSSSYWRNHYDAKRARGECLHCPRVALERRRLCFVCNEKNNAKTRRQQKTNNLIRLRKNLRNRINKSLKTSARPGQRAGSAVRDLGCSIPALRAHLESKFQPGMTWENWGEWHIDHIRPLASFDLTDREQFLAACHYTNLQPLWAQENLKKGAAI